MGGDRFRGAVAGMEGGTEQADPADPSPWLWEDKMETRAAAGGRLPEGPGGFAGAARGQDGGEEGVAPPASQPGARPLSGIQLVGA